MHISACACCCTLFYCTMDVREERARLPPGSHALLRAPKLQCGCLQAIAYFSGAAAAQDLGTAVRAFALEDSQAAAPEPHCQAGVAGGAGSGVSRAQNPAGSGLALGESAVSGGLPAPVGAAGAGGGRGHRGAPEQALAPSQAPAAVKRVAVRSLGAPEWRLRAADPREAYRDGTCCSNALPGLQHDSDYPRGDLLEEPAGSATAARAGTEVLRAAFRIKGALRASGCAGMLSFPAGEGWSISWLCTLFLPGCLLCAGVLLVCKRVVSLRI